MNSQHWKITDLLRRLFITFLYIWDHICPRLSYLQNSSELRMYLLQPMVCDGTDFLKHLSVIYLYLSTMYLAICTPICISTCLPICLGVEPCATANTWQSEDKSVKSLSPSTTWTLRFELRFRLDDRCFYQLSHLIRIIFIWFTEAPCPEEAQTCLLSSMSGC